MVTMQGAWLWTDGRYHLQASEQINPDLWTLMKHGALCNVLTDACILIVLYPSGTPDVPSLEEWMSKVCRISLYVESYHSACVCVCVCMCVQELASGSRIGFDPSLTSFSEFITSVMLGVSLSLSLSLSLSPSLSLRGVQEVC